MGNKLGITIPVALDDSAARRAHGNPSAYEVRILPGLLSRLGDHLPEFTGRRLLIVADRVVAQHYGTIALSSLSRAGIDAQMLPPLPPGEEGKSLGCLSLLYAQMAELALTRTDGLLALGGGVIGDLTGYAAATYLRGIDCVQVPTTLLAQVDSAIGGKTGIDLAQGKNLIGTFHNPFRVLIDPDALRTLDAVQLRNGFAEVVKTAAVGDAELFGQLERLDHFSVSRCDEEWLRDVIERCCRIKARYVRKDPCDTGVRGELNFGHTLGHALESATQYRMLHGEAISIGMHIASRVGERFGITQLGTADRIRRVLDLFGLPYALPPLPEHAWSEPLLRDKKRGGDKLRLVLLRDVGRASLQAFPVKTALNAIQVACRENATIPSGYLPP